MMIHNLPLFVGESAWFFQNSIGDVNFAHVMHHTEEPDSFSIVFGKADFDTNGSC
jgi:hypothetical protein